MRWQKAARLGVAVVGLGTAAAIYALTRERPVQNKPQVSTTFDPKATAQSGAGEQVRYDGNRLLGTVKFDGSRAYEDGRTEWDKFYYRFESDGTVVSADHVAGRNTNDPGKTAEYTLTGHVRLQGPDKMALSGESATFNEATGIVNVPGPASFARGRMSGSGT